MAWWELRLAGLPRRHIDGISAVLFEAGTSGVQEDWLPGTEPAPRQPWDDGPVAPLPDRIVLRAWFEDPDRPAVERSIAPVEAELSWAPVVETDWEAAWRASFQPLVLTPRLTIAPPWDAPAGALIIEPGQGFGSGAHPTTRMALVAVDELADTYKTAIDVGCGSGVLAIAAARLGLEVVGIDVDEPSIRDSIANAERNGVRCDFSTAPVSALEDAADLVLANLHAELIVALSDDLVRLTGSWLVLAGIIDEREQKVRDALDHRMELVDRTQDGPWVGLRYRPAP